MKSWIKCWIYHFCINRILAICRKDPFYASMFIGEAELLRQDLKLPTVVLDSAEMFIASTRRHLRG